jgi:hypothetical protein
MPSQFYRKVISLSKTPADFPKKLQPVETAGEDRLASTVEDTLSATVVDKATSTVEEIVTSTVEDKGLWRGEGADGVFTASRIRRIVRAQDVLTHVEEAVYDILWGSKKRSEDAEEDRLTRMGYAELASQSRVSKRTIQSIVERLIEKGFVHIHEPADIYHRKPTVYRVLGYGAVLRWMRSTGRRFVLRTGRGVFYAQPLTSTVEARPSTTVEARSASTVEASSPSTVEASAPSTVELPSTTSLGSKEKAVQAATASASPLLEETCHRYGIVLDAAAARLIPKRCRTYDPAATEQEIAHFTETKILQLRGSTRIANIVGLLLTAVPEFFVEPAHEVKVYRHENALASAAGDRRTEAIVEEDRAREESDRLYSQLPPEERTGREDRCLALTRAEFPRLAPDEQKRIARQRSMLEFHENRAAAPVREGKS